MILIISDDLLSVNDVIDLLKIKKEDFIRITSSSKIEIEEIRIENKSIFYTLKVDSIKINSHQIKSIYIRKGRINLSPSRIQFKSKALDKNELTYNIEYEKEIVLEFFNQIWKETRSLGSLKNQNLNKLLALKAASEVGFKIPNTLITQSIPIISEEYFYKKEQLIVKPIGEVPKFFNQTHYFKAFTSRIDDKISKIKSISLSKIQNEIKKLFEIRVFYLLGKTYSVAIFSQNEDQTSIDLRNYNYNNIERHVPFVLPESEDLKLNLLMNKLDLNIGSIDLILTNELEYCFLEINPVGQYGYTDFIGSYQINDKIVNYLINGNTSQSE